jgi:hypothetical protein
MLLARSRQRENRNREKTMTREIDISQGPAAAKLRDPRRVALLSVATFGIYWAVWYYKINREMRDYGASCEDRELAASRPVSSLLAVIVCPFWLFAPMISLVRTVGRLQRVERLASGSARRGTGLIVLLVGGDVMSIARSFQGAVAVSLLGFAAWFIASALIQGRLNAVWRASGIEPMRQRPSDPVAMDAPLVAGGSLEPVVSGGGLEPAVAGGGLEVVNVAS